MEKENCFKIRMAIALKTQRQIRRARCDLNLTCLLPTTTDEFTCLPIYDKSEKEDISDKELKTLNRNQCWIIIVLLMNPTLNERFPFLMNL